jgi:hypothetical protein
MAKAEQIQRYEIHFAERDTVGIYELDMSIHRP